MNSVNLNFKGKTYRDVYVGKVITIDVGDVIKGQVMVIHNGDCVVYLEIQEVLQGISVARCIDILDIDKDIHVEESGEGIEVEDKVDLNSMTKKELIELAKTIGVNIDSRDKKAKILSEVKKVYYK